MKERPLLFNGEMVRAILDGRKTQTRRVIKPQPVHAQVHEHNGKVLYDGEHRLWWWKNHSWDRLLDAESERKQLAKFSPYGQPGDRLWVPEGWRTTPGYDSWKPSELPERVYLQYSDESTNCGEWLDWGKWRPSIYMPRWASRITLEVTDVRVERVQEISPSDAKAEGDKERSGFPEYHAHGAKCHVNWFRDLWNSIYGERSWEENDWVWVVEFKKGQGDDQR
jgi:hypothetical protein